MLIKCDGSWIYNDKMSQTKWYKIITNSDDYVVVVTGNKMNHSEYYNVNRGTKGICTT